MEDRGDCFLVYDNVSKHPRLLLQSNTEARNSSYAAVYYPSVQIQMRNKVTSRIRTTINRDCWCVFRITVGQPWFAPAGLNRGGIDSADSGAYKKLTQGNRDDLYDSNVNPIATFQVKVLHGLWTKDNTEESKCFRQS